MKRQIYEMTGRVSLAHCRMNIIHHSSFQQEEDEPSRRLCLAATIPAAQPSDKK